MMTITAKKGFRFTQQREVDIESRIVVKSLYLSDLESIDSWKEISESEAAEILSKQKERIDERVRKNGNIPYSDNKEI